MSFFLAPAIFEACYIRCQLESNDEEIIRFKKIIQSLHFTKTILFIGVVTTKDQHLVETPVERPALRLKFLVMKIKCC